MKWLLVIAMFALEDGGEFYAGQPIFVEAVGVADTYTECLMAAASLEISLNEKADMENRPALTTTSCTQVERGRLDSLAAARGWKKF